MPRAQHKLVTGCIQGWLQSVLPRTQLGHSVPMLCQAQAALAAGRHLVVVGARLWPLTQDAAQRGQAGGGAAPPHQCSVPGAKPVYTLLAGWLCTCAAQVTAAAGDAHQQPMPPAGLGLQSAHRLLGS